MEDDIQINESDLSAIADSLGSELGQGESGSAAPVAPSSAAAGAPAASPPSGAQAAAPAPSLPDPYATPPKSWAKDYHPKWTSLDPEVRKYVHQREEQMLQGITQYKRAADFGSRLQQQIQPYAQVLQQHNIDPVQAFDVMMRAHLGMTMGDAETKKQWAQYIVQNYGLDQVLGAAQAGDPQAQAVVQELKGQVSQLQEMILGDKRKAIESEIQAFASNPENKYFDDLFDDIVQVIQKGQATNIAEAYQAAMWLNPAVREKVIAERLAAQSQTPGPSPKPTNAPLRSSSEPTIPSRAASSIEDTLEQAYSRVIQ